MPARCAELPPIQQGILDRLNKEITTCQTRTRNCDAEMSAQRILNTITGASTQPDPGATFARAGDTKASQQVRSATCWNWVARWNVHSTLNPWCAEIQRREGCCGVIP